MTTPGIGAPIEPDFWDGSRISRYFDYNLDRWVTLP
jgi:hypothetical protein